MRLENSGFKVVFVKIKQKKLDKEHVIFKKFKIKRFLEQFKFRTPFFLNHMFVECSVLPVKKNLKKKTFETCIISHRVYKH